MSFSRTLVTTAAVLLLGGVALAAPTSSTAKKQTEATSNSAMKKMKTHHEWGTVDSVSDTSLTLTHTYKGKTETSNFTLDPSTKKVGDIDKGARVEVFYRDQNGEHVATEVKARKTKMKKM